MKNYPDIFPYKLDPPFRHIHYTGYEAILPEYFGDLLADDDINLSPLRILENGQPLRWPHSETLAVFYSGGGVYNHTGNKIFFSTPDGTDPNSNGRSYEIILAEKKQKGNSLPFPERVHITLSITCNLWCRICRPKPVKAPFMDFRLFEKIADELLPVSGLRLDSGGELLMNPDLEKILKKLNDLDQPFFTSSNGMLLTHEKARLLAESSLRHIQISVDSPEKATLEWIRRGSKFERIIEGIKNLVQARKEVGRPFLISFHAAVMRQNVRQMPDLVRLAKSLGVAGVTACHLYAHDCTEPDASCFWNQAEYDEMREKTIETAKAIGSFYYGPAPFSSLPTGKKTAPKTCIYPDSGTYINPDGSVTPCCVATNYTMGNIADSSFEEIWNGEKYRRLRQTYLTENPSLPKCLDCLGKNGVTESWKSYFAPAHWDYVKNRLDSEDVKNTKHRVNKDE